MFTFSEIESQMQHTTEEKKYDPFASNIHYAATGRFSACPKATIITI